MGRVALLLAVVIFPLHGLCVSWALAQDTRPLRVFLRAGPKTHGPAGNGLHDHQVWLHEWQPLLTSRGAVVQGGLQFPTEAQLDTADVLVMFAANAGTIVGDQRAALEKFLRRGGGIVVLHDALVAAEDPLWFKTIVGGAWENKVARFFEGENTHYYVNSEHPITNGASNFNITDEVYWNLHMMPTAHVLGVAMQPVPPGQPAPEIGRLIPQVWVYENQLPGGEPYRAFVSLHGHHYSTFSSRHVRGLILRGIAWAGKRDADSLASRDEVLGLQ